MLVIPLNRQECSPSLFISTLLEVLTKKKKIHKNWKGQNIPVIIYRRYYCLIGNPKELRKRIKFFKTERLALLSYTIDIQISIAFSPSSSDGTESACNAGDPGSVLGSGRSPGEENDNPLQYSCMRNPMDRGAW